MTKAAKLRIMGTVTVLMAIGFIMMKNVPIARMVLLGVWIAHVIVFVFGIKTAEEAMTAQTLEEKGLCDKTNIKK